jgi:hypothetical protein
MLHIANTAHGRIARNQEELLRIANSSSAFKEERLEHPLCETGFNDYSDSGLERMTPDSFKMCVVTLLKSRPAWRYFDVIPGVSYTKTTILDHAIEGFRMSFDQKAQFLSEEFAMRPKMVGFKLELHNVDTTAGTSTGRPSLSCTIYESEEELDDRYVPVEIECRYRTTF